MSRTIYLSLTLFLLTADLLFVVVGGVKLKYGYFLVLGMWLFAPAAMYGIARDAARRVPKYVFLVLVPMAIAVLTSVDVHGSLAWTTWLAFDLFTVVTLYAFLEAGGFTQARIQSAAAGSLALLAAFGLLQFALIFEIGKVVFSPQHHLGTYRINGLAGWPHFLNIFAFLLLPIVLTKRRIGALTWVMLAVLVFVLAQSTAKTGWVLLVALVLLLLLFDRLVLLRKLLVFVVPMLVIALWVPIPSVEHQGETTTGAAKLAKFADDRDRTSSLQERMLINEMGFKVWLRHPWFGVGPRAYDSYVLSHFDVELPEANKFDVRNEINFKNENIWIEFLAETGILFTLGFAAIVVRALWVPRWKFANPLQRGAWIALVLYFAISGQVSQTGLLTLVYAVFGVYFYARDLAPDQATGGLPPGPQHQVSAVVRSAPA